MLLHSKVQIKSSEKAGGSGPQGLTGCVGTFFVFFKCVVMPQLSCSLLDKTVMIGSDFGY